MNKEEHIQRYAQKAVGTWARLFVVSTMLPSPSRRSTREGGELRNKASIREAAVKVTPELG